MSEQRTLLEFAIAASVAIVPVLLAVLVIVAEVRPSDPWRRRDAMATGM